MEPLSAAFSALSRTRLGLLVQRLGWRPWHYLLLLGVHAHLFLSGKLAAARDLRNDFYPWTDALRLSVVRFHQFPWWNPWPLGGTPLFADPQNPVLVPDLLLIIAFGTVVGLKMVIFAYECVGYEGSRRLCLHLFGRSRFVEAASVIPAIFPPLALHFGEGHMVFVVFLLFPWVLFLALTWQNSTKRSFALGVFVAWHLLSYIHYSIIISFSIAGPVAAFGFVRCIRRRETWLRAALVLSTALSLSFVRIGTTFPLLAHFPRTELAHYPLAFPLSSVITSLIEPLQDRTYPLTVAGLQWWELGTYVGLLVMLMAYESFRTFTRKGFLLVGMGLLCLVLAWNNRDKPFPSYYLHFVPPWDHMLVITRWRLYGAYFLLLAAVHGLTSLYARGRPRLAAAVALLIVCDLSFHVVYGYRDTFTEVAPPYGEFGHAPVTHRNQDTKTWDDIRANEVSLGAQCSLLGYGYHYPARRDLGTPGYGGDFPGAQVLRWTPNRIVLTATPGDTLTLNINPSNYWLLNGSRLFPDEREFDIEKPFTVVVPPSGRLDLRARPPGLTRILLIQAAFCLCTLLLIHILRRQSAQAMDKLGTGPLGCATSE